jgi:putative acetyltransferase
VVGCIGVDRVDERTAEIHRLYLDAHLRGRGLGRVLVETALAWARQQGFARMLLWSDTRFTASHRLYDRMGFARLGERTVPNDPNDSREYRFERDL